MTLLACLLSIFAALCVYLTSDRQRLRAAPLDPRWRLAAAALAIAGLVIWARAISVPAAIFASLTSWMTAFVLLPYIAWARTRPVAESHASRRVG
jgi:hypothetical protein